MIRLPSRWQDWCSAYACVAVFSYIVVATTIPYLYGPLLAALVTTSLVAVCLRRPRVPRALWGWVLALVAVGVMGTLWGLVNSNPGARSQVSIFVVEPLVIGLLLGLMPRVPGGRRWLFRSMDVALMVASALGALLYVSNAAHFELPTWLVQEEFRTVDTTGTTLATNFQGYNGLVFLAAYGIFRSIRFGRSGHQLYRVALFMAAFSGVVLAGRSILYLTVPCALLLGAVFFWRRPATRWMTFGIREAVLPVVAILAFGVFLQSVTGATPAQVGARTAGQARVADDSGVRGPQAVRLTEEWLESPIWGHGTGHTVDGYVRNADAPWRFELSYLVLLMSFGIVGGLVLLAWMAWMSWRLLRLGRDGDVGAQAVLVGLASAVAATASNPYLFKIESMWMVFVPLGLAVASRQVGAMDQVGEVAKR